MHASKGSLEKVIMNQLTLYYAVGENKLYEMCRAKNDDQDTSIFSKAIANLYMKGLIEVVKDPTDTQRIVRLKQSYQ